MKEIWHDFVDYWTDCRKAFVLSHGVIALLGIILGSAF